MSTHGPFGRSAHGMGLLTEGFERTEVRHHRQRLSFGLAPDPLRRSGTLPVEHLAATAEKHPHSSMPCM